MAEPHAKSPAFTPVTLADLVSELKLEFMSQREAGDVRFLRFNWPRKNNGTRYDRTIMVTEWRDGSWSASLVADDRNPVAQLRRMAAAMMVW